MFKNPGKKRFRYRDLSISKKIYLPNVLIIVFLIVVSGIIANTFVFDALIERVTLNTRQSLDIIIQSLDNLLNEVETGASKVAGDPAVQAAIISSKPGDPIIDFDSSGMGGSIQGKIVSLKNVVDTISLYGIDGRKIGSGSISGQKYDDPHPLGASAIKLMMDSGGRTMWIDEDSGTAHFETPSASGITMLRAVRRGNVGDLIGVLRIDINKNIFSKLYSHLDYGRTGRFIVVNRVGSMVFPESSDLGLYSEFFRKRYIDLFAGSDTQGQAITFGKERFVVISNLLDRLGWIIIGMVPVNELMDYGQRVTWFIYLIGVICVLCEIAFSAWVSLSISRPISALSQSMLDAAQGDLQIRVPESGGDDEIGTLSRSFNQMVERIADLMDQVYRDQKKQRELELLALQSQINPHFLYNSLESICALSQLKENEEAFRLGKALSMFYRGVLSGGQLVVGIDEELKTLRHYLTIQGIRYRDKFQCSFDVDEAILSQRIIKLSLQPIVENSIYHGLKTVRRQGRVSITGRRVGPVVELRVVDNGKGMTEVEIAEVLRPKTDSSEPRGFGLYSVDQRLKLYFGEEYGVSIESRPGFWTKVVVRVPFAEAA